MNRYNSYYDCEYEAYIPNHMHQKENRRPWGIIPWALLLGAILFGCGFLLGTVRASDPAPRTEPPAVTQFPMPGSVSGSGTEPSVTPEAPRVSAAPPHLPDDDWALTLVNWENPVPEGYSIPELVELRNGQSIDRRAYPDLQRMMDDCRAAGLDPLICSSYRTEEFQTQLFENKVSKYINQGYDRAEAESLAMQWVARPGTSEHQLGLAVDIVDTGYQNLDEQQEQTAVQQWLLENCAEYGFILRYPTDKAELTGVNYEPWHYRYVGSAAKGIMEQGVCLEEYLAR